MAKQNDNSEQFAQFLSTLTLICITALVSFVSQIILHPVYGSVATGLHHNSILLITSFTPLIVSSGRLETRKWQAIAMLMISAPLNLPALFSFSGICGPVWGPVLTQTVLTWPCVFFTSHTLHRQVKRSWALRILCSVGLVAAIRWSHEFLASRFLPYIGILWSRFSILVYLGLLAILVDNIPLFKRHEFVTLAFTFGPLLPILIYVLSQPHVLPGVTDGLLARLPPEYTYLARQESITGMITVVENSVAGYRVLKCDHSLLGGLWTGIKKRELEEELLLGDLDSRSVDEAESVYTAFYLQEAARLVERNDRDSRGDKALIMYTYCLKLS